jgi:hypothetical protein
MKNQYLISSFTFFICLLGATSQLYAQVSDEEFDKIINDNNANNINEGEIGVSNTNEGNGYNIQQIDSNDLFREIDEQQIIIRNLNQQIEIEKAKKQLRDLTSDVSSQSFDSTVDVSQLRQEILFLRSALEELRSENEVNMQEQQLQTMSKPQSIDWVAESISIAGDRRSAVIRTGRNQVFRVNESDKVGNVRIVKVEHDQIKVHRDGMFYIVPRQSIDYRPASVRNFNDATITDSSNIIAHDQDGERGASISSQERSLSQPTGARGQQLRDSTSFSNTN